ncbi:MAG: sulfate adenylyltransferase subunit CysD [Vitreoscilla sp.]|nr:sulfate adenylyltransferase subunit CysD [Vitreoscilla sp.]
MTRSSLDIAALNARRRRAVQLRIDGLSLTQIREATGLSVPTIIRSAQAFEAGGWAAIDVAPRGRPRGGGRVLTPEQEQALRQAALAGPPERWGLTDPWWTGDALRQLAQRHFGVLLEPRAISRLLERWGLALAPLRGQTAPAAAAWVAEHWAPAVQAARDGGSHVAWAGSLSHPGVPSPGGLLVASSPRGSLAWLPVPSLATADSHLDFLQRLLRSAPGPWRVFLHGPDFRRVPAVQHWLVGQTDLQLLPCPVAPRARRPAETLQNDAVARSLDEFTPAPGAEIAPPPTSITLSPEPTAEKPAAAAIIAPTAERSAPFHSHPPDSTDATPMNLTHLQRLEAESIHIMREVVAEADNPVMLYSIGKDSAVMLHLAKKAFFPSPPPFPLLHVDTTWKFRAMYEMRDRMAKELGMDLLVHHNPEAMELGINPFTHGSQIHTDMWKTQGLKQALDKYNFDVAFGGARRDEEKSRAKERIFSFRSAQHRWDPKNQRPELWRLYNGRKQKGESIRCFPISNWTELDIWQYIYLENVPIVPLYFAAKRPVVDRDGTLIMVDDDRMPLRDGEVPMMKSVRFRTLGCYPLSGAVESEADTLPSIIQEMLLTKTSERQGRMIDHDAAASMEKKKQEGYF